MSDRARSALGVALIPASLALICAGAATAGVLQAAAHSNLVVHQSSYVVRDAGKVGPKVRPAFPGEILGYDINRNGSDGVLANYRDLHNGQTESSLETFDQVTGKITKVVFHGTTQGFAVDGIVAGDVALLSTNSGFALMNPVTGGKVSGSWAPPTKFFLGQIATNQDTSTQVIFGYDGSKSSQPTALLVADIPNRHTKVIPLDQNLFGTGDVPVIAQDTATNQAVIAGGNGAPNTRAMFGIVDLATGKTTTFQGLGFGFVNGLDVDSKRGIACATTEIDAGVELYDLKKHTGFEVILPNSAGQQIHSGAGVAVDSDHGLCLVAQPVSGNGLSASAIWVLDESGNFREEILGFNFWFGVGPTINPSKRSGYVLNPRPSYLTLTGFTY